MLRRVYNIIRHPFKSDPGHSSGPETPAGGSSSTAVVSANGVQLTLTYESPETAIPLINPFTAGTSIFTFFLT